MAETPNGDDHVAIYDLNHYQSVCFLQRIVGLMGMANLMLVDDDENANRLLGTFLESIGHSVRCFANATEAVHALLGDQPELILLDLGMPKMSGIEFLETLRSYMRFRTLPVIIITGQVSGSEHDRARELNVVRILIKGSTTSEEIAAAISETLAGR